MPMLCYDLCQLSQEARPFLSLNIKPCNTWNKCSVFLSIQISALAVHEAGQRLGLQVIWQQAYIVLQKLGQLVPSCFGLGKFCPLLQGDLL